MKILVIGTGAREHALVWKLAQSPRVKKIYCVSGNAGIEELAELVTISPVDIPQILQFAKKESIDLTVVGPEAPLALGIVDAFEKEGLPIFGPRKNAAIVESSKCFSKDFCVRHQIPTAPYVFFSNASEAKRYLDDNTEYPVVIKADGLAAGKGVIIAKNKVQADEAIDEMLVYEKFGQAGRTIIIEEFMPGEEATFMVVTDGTHAVALASSQDHKRAFDHDEGPNTGGMGAYSPAPIVTEDVHAKVMKNIITPFIKGMKKEGRTYVGILYAGLMIQDGEPRVVEFNCRFGDPEAEVILTRMESDLVKLIEATIDGKLKDYEVEFSDKHSVCVVMAAGGYPGNYETGKPIEGLPQAARFKDVNVFHAGTRYENRSYATNGGRVLVVTALGKTLQLAIDQAYKACEKISWEGVHYRKDIGHKALKQ